MRFRHLLKIGLAAGLVAAAVAPAFAQLRPMVPMAPVPVPVAPLPLRPSLPTALSPQPLPMATPLPAVPAPLPMVPTRPEPPVVRPNPPILPLRHDDCPKDEDPLWMSRTLDKVNQERRDWNVTYDASRIPPPPPPLAIPPVPVVPVDRDTRDEFKWSNWLVLGAMLIGIGAFAVGRATRAR